MMVLSAMLVILLAGIGWLKWTDRHPQHERELREQVHDFLLEHFPDQMTLPDQLLGWIPRSQRFPENQPPDVILLHGLDEPGGIWDELVPPLDEAGFNAWEFRYPNDQAINRSADLLAEYWSELEFDQPPVLIGHSMGGLVIRDFITRHLSHDKGDADFPGPSVRAVIQVATPNQGSEWVRLRAWLEIREWIADIRAGRFSLFAGLRDGTGAAKIDLRPDSQFLAELNQRDWPVDIPIRIIGGQLSEPTPGMIAGVDALASDLDAPELADALEQMWSQLGEDLGDGVVPIESLHLPEAPEPVIVPASHRGLLVTLPLTETEPPAIDLIVEWLKEF
jgi:pimeloyl-ACP methyl ester carboxylesterase